MAKVPAVQVEAPVTAQVGPVYLRLFPYQQWQTAVDDYDERPWAWGALCRVKFRIGELTTTKRVQTRYAFHGPKAWPSQERPNDEALAEGKQAVLDNLRTQLERHGFKPPEFVVIEEEVEPKELV